MNVGPILGNRFSGRHRSVHWLRAFHGVRRLGYVWFRWMLLHAPKTCNKPALEGFA